MNGIEMGDVAWHHVQNLKRRELMLEELLQTLIVRLYDAEVLTYDQYTELMSRLTVEP